MLFKELDLFIIHGGLGTTVEALRMKKPTCVTGPLLLDQRFWGSVCAQKGVGPPPVHIDNFESCCVSFVEGALDPADPHGWQRRAQEQDWGDELEDGVGPNVEAFKQLVELVEATGLAPIKTSVPSRSPVRRCLCLCLSRRPRRDEYANDARDTVAHGALDKHQE